MKGDGWVGDILLWRELILITEHLNIEQLFAFLLVALQELVITMRI
jgi:hypothetical protein